MAIAYDAVSNATPGTGNLSWTHTPSGTPKGVIVFIVQNSGSTDEVSSVTYGGTSMTEVSGSPLLHTSGETGVVYCYTLLSSIPTGAQTVAVTVSGSSTKIAVCYTVTAGTSTTVIQDVDDTINSTSLQNPSVTLSHAGNGCFCAIGFHSGQNAVGSNTALSNWTESYEYDYGTQTAGVYRFNQINTTDTTAGWSENSSDDATMIAIALRENIVNLSPSGIASTEAFGTAKTTLKISPSGITSIEAFGTHTILSGTSSIKIKSNKGYMSTTSSLSSYAHAIGYAAPKSNAEVYLDFTWGDISTKAALRVFLRASRDWNTSDKPTQGYELVVDNDGGYVVNRIQSGSRTQLGTGSWTATTNASALRFQVIGSVVKAKVWTGSEPAWGVDYNDTGGFTTAGITQVALTNVSGTSPHSVSIDNFAYQTPTSNDLYPNSISSAEVFGTPSIRYNQVIALTTGIPTAQIIGSHTVAVSAVTILPTGIASAESFGTPNLPTGTENRKIAVGNMFTDGSPRQIVRTSGNRAYEVGINCESYPDLTANGMDQTIRVFRGNTVGVASGFTRKDSSNEPAAATVVSCALDSDDNIRIVWTARSSQSLVRYLRYAVFNTGTDTWGSVTTIASNLDYDDSGQGDESVACAIDANNVVHVVYLSTEGSGVLSDRRIYYRNNSGGSWSSATQLDSDVTYTGNQKAWHPSISFDSDGSINVVWLRGTFNDNNDATIYFKKYSGSWGSAVSIASSMWTGIDTALSLVIDKNRRYHLAYLGTTSKYVRYSYSDNYGTSWSANNPSNFAGDDPTVVLWGSKIRIYVHGNTSSPTNIGYFEGDGGSSSWGSWTNWTNESNPSANYDCSVSYRWAQYNYWYPNTIDFSYWQADYPSNYSYMSTTILKLDIQPTGIASAQAFGTAGVKGIWTISPGGIASAQALGTPTIQVGAVQISPSGIASAQTFGAATINVGSVSIAPSGIATVGAFGTPVIQVGVTQISPSSIVSAQAFGTFVVSTGSVSIAPSSITSAQAIGSPTIAVGSVNIIPTGIVSAQAFGSGLLIRYDLIFKDNFETGNLSKWTSVTDPDNDLVINSDAALVGGLGLALTIDDTTAVTLNETFSNAEPRFRLRFYIDPNDLTISNTGTFYFMQTSSGGLTGCKIDFGRNDSIGGYVVRISAYLDTSTYVHSSYYLLNNARNYVEVDYKVADYAGANNGYFALYINGSLKETLSSLDNDTRTLNSIKLGAVAYVPTNTSGILYIDDVEMRRSTYIGPAVTISPTSITSNEAIGSATITTGSVNIAPTGISSVETFGNPLLKHTIQTSGIPSAETFGNAVVLPGSINISPNGIASAEVIGSIIVSVGIKYIVPGGIASTETFGNVLLLTGSVNISPAGIASGEAIGSLVISRGTVSIIPAGISSAQAFGTVVRITLYILPSGILGAENFGTSTISVGSIIIAPLGISSSETLGSPLIEAGVKYVAPGSIASAEAFGTAVLTTGMVSISPSSVNSGEFFGTPSIKINITLNGISSTEAFGAAQIISAFVISPSSILSGEIWGTAKVSLIILASGIPSVESFSIPQILRGAITILVSSIASLESFGTPQISCGTSSIVVGSITSAESFGGAVISAGGIVIQVQSISSLEAFGSFTISVGPVYLVPDGIVSAQAFGSAKLTLSILPLGIGSGQTFGAPIVTTGSVALYPSGITSEELFGEHLVNAGQIFIIGAGNITSGQAFGATVIQPGVVHVYPDMIYSGETFALPQLGVGGVTVSPYSIDSAEGFGVSVFDLTAVIEFFDSYAYLTIAVNDEVEIIQGMESSANVLTVKEDVEVAIL